jgi:hypothetical protein
MPPQTDSLKEIIMNSRKGILSLVCAVSLSLLACREPASGLTSQASNPNVNWTQYTDPFEQAFSLQVPQGWTVQGGLFRMGYSDERPMVNLKSPDGQVEIRFGDVSVPSYTPPNPYHTREGEIYDLGAQAQMVVEHYRTGPEYAVMYAHSRFAHQCRNPQAPPSVTEFSVPDVIPVSGDQVSAGQIAYVCQTDSGQKIALTYVKTVRVGQIWQVATLVSIMAPSGRLDDARSIALHSAQSFHLSQQWMAYQQQMDAEGLQYQRARQQRRRDELGQQVQQFEARMHAMQNQVNSFERHQAAFQGQVDQFSNALNGLTPTTDPLTGENRMVWTGTKDGYWVNGQGQVMNSHDAPAPGWRQLQTPQ